MSVFHRIDDVAAMPAQRFIDFAIRLVAYKGVIRTLVEATEREAQSGSSAAPAPAVRPDRLDRDRTLPSDSRTLSTDPAFVGIFEQKGGPNG